MRSGPLRLGLVGLVVWFGVAILRAADPPAEGAAKAPRSISEEAIHQVVKDYVAAINAGDFKKVSEFWTADGDYADPSGRVIKARPVIEADLARRFGGPQRPTLVVDVESVRLIAPDVAVEDGRAEVTPADGSPATRGRYTAVWVKQQGKWLLNTLRESMPIRTPHRERLAALDWLVGDWKGTTGGMTVYVASHWNDERTYLIREIEVEQQGKRIQTSSQRLGWDPLSRRIKAWTFDADGGHAESYWTRQDNDWVAQSTGVTGDGQINSARNVYRQISPEGYTLDSVEARTGGEHRADFTIHFVRQAHEAEIGGDHGSTAN